MRNSKFLTDATVAKRFGVHASTIKRWRLEGRLGFTRIGPRRVAIRPEDVEAFIQSGNQPSRKAVPKAGKASVSKRGVKVTKKGGEK